MARCANWIFASLKSIGKISIFQFEEYFKDGSDTHIVHFIGKDIIYFHALFGQLFWKVQALKADAIYVKWFPHDPMVKEMSKSRGTFIKARTYLDHLDPEYLRYYFAYKSSAGVDDFDLDTEDFHDLE